MFLNILLTNQASFFILGYNSGMQKVRLWVYSVFVLVVGISYLINRRKHRKNLRDNDKRNIEKNFEKDENGKYPWENDTNDDPSRAKGDRWKL